ncbi:MAG: TetR/AcrR family transcriptional regulator [Lachnospiraceae bacterium]|nr:TetR/AcrR family transcriptional regulator [Lachnospiraceae bacterium]
MEQKNTKAEILDAALDLFAINGYESTSMSQIAKAVGVRKASIYSHFENKSEILKNVVQMVLDGYNMNSIFANASWDDSEFTKDKSGMNADDYAKLVKGHIRYIIHDPYVRKGRMLLVIEQFRNEELSQLQTKMNYEDIMKYFTGMINYLIKQDILVDANSEIMAAQFCLPITTWINLCDREPDRENEILELIENHIKKFFEVYHS